METYSHPSDGSGPNFNDSLQMEEDGTKGIKSLLIPYWSIVPETIDRNIKSVPARD